MRWDGLPSRWRRLPEKRKISCAGHWHGFRNLQKRMKMMNNSMGDRAEKTLEFQKQVEKRTGLPVILWDERLTTRSADLVLQESGVRRENRKACIDQIAAIFILQGYLDHLAMEQKAQDQE